MTQEKEEVTIPSMDDFSESSLLDQVQLHTKEEEEEEEQEEQEEEEEKKEVPPKVEEEEEHDEEEEESEEESEESEKKSEEEDSFWDDVDAITGNTYEVDYGDVDPASPEGAALREEVVAKTAIEENLNSLADKYPQAFQALQHVANGGKFEDFISPGEVDYSTLEIGEEDVAKQKSFMKDYYMSKGLSEAKAVRNVEDDEDSEEGLFNNFKVALEERQTSQAKEREEIIARQARVKEAQDARDRQFGDAVATILKEGTVGNFKVPKADSEKFYEFILGHTQRLGDGYAFTIPIDNAKFSKQLEQMFFGFKEGDLSKYVDTKAKTKAARRLKRNVQKEKTDGESRSEDGTRKRTKKLPTLGSFEAE